LLYIVVLGIYLTRDILATNERELGPVFDRIYAECLTDYMRGGGGGGKRKTRKKKKNKKKNK
jgi:hypothetical protein